MGGASFAQDAAKAAADKAAAAKAAAALPVTGAPTANDPAAVADKGRQLFTDYGCGSCHTLGDAGATGHVGPALDGNPNVTADFVADRVTNGQGMMPSFASQLTPDEIKTLATYVAQVATK
jgi:mono/diheme cytochrome c family protein